MRCERARALLSAAHDGELPADQREAAEAHVADCRDCAGFRDGLARLRRAVRYEPVAAVPDVAPAVVALAAVAQRRRRRRGLGAVAAAFLAAAVAGAAFVGLDARDPAQVRAEVPDRIVAAQTLVTSLAADVEVVERGWHHEVPERRHQGRLSYRAPESLALRLTDRTAYPDGRWVPNDIDVVAHDDRWWARGPMPCPVVALPDCADPMPRVRAVVRREPFRAATPAPLDLVVPVRSFALAAEPPQLSSRAVAGRDAVGVETSAAQVAPLLDGFRQAGTIREVHPTDPVELWLDDAALVPLAVTVRAADGPERALWAARRGYTEEAGERVLEITLDALELNGPVDDDVFAGPPASTPSRDAGFVDQPRAAVDVPEPSWLPDGMRAHRSGIAGGSVDAPEVAVAAWSDGRAWVKVRATRDWDGEHLFGRMGEAVRRVRVDAGVAYVGEGGRAVALHGREADVVVTGSLPEADLLRVAGSLGIVGLPVPPSWREAGVIGLEEVTDRVEGALRPPRLEGFAPAAARVTGGTLVIAVPGPGARGFVLTQPPASALAPPLEPDVRGVEVRGAAGRYTPSTGELEWVEDGRVVSLRSSTLSVDALVAIAERLEQAPSEEAP